MEAPGTVTLSLISDYRLKVDFGLAGVPDLTTDAAPPLGRGQGPDSERLLMAAVGNCLTASLAFSLRKYKNAEVAMQATVDARLAPNEQGRWRMSSMSVVIRLGVPMASLRLAERALAQYEDFCVVTQSVRAAIPVDVKVFDSEGAPLTP